MSAQRPFQVLVFDWDGTLADSERRIVSAAQAAMVTLGLPARSAADIKSIIGLALSEACEVLYPGLGADQRSRFVAGYREHYARAAGVPVPLFPGVVEALRSLAGQRYLLAIATGKSRRGLLRDLDNHDIAELFATTRCADDAPSKPHPQMLLDIMAELDASDEDTLMIGDTAFDLEMARNAGVARVAVRCGMHEPARLLEFDPLTLLDSVAGLPAWLSDVA